MSQPADSAWPPELAELGLPPSSLPTSWAPLLPADHPWSEIAKGGAGSRASAVLVLFILPEQQGAAARLLVIRRSTKLRSHRGQIGFAGGLADPGDLSPLATATRELHEEVGISPERVHALGRLPPVASHEGFLVHPVIGAAAVTPADLRPEPAEVDQIFSEPWPYFAADRDRPFGFNIFGNWRTSHLFTAPSVSVWGLSARILWAAALA